MINITEKEIEKLIQPLVDNQIIQEEFIINTIAEQLGKAKNILPSQVAQLEQLLKTGNNAQKINKKLSQLSGMSEKQIKQIIKAVAEDSYMQAKPYYDYRNKPFIAFEDNKQLQKTIKAIELVSLGEYRRLSNTAAFMIRDLVNPNILRPTKLSKIYNKAIDYAVQQIVSGLYTYNQVIPQVISNLVNDGIQVVEYNQPDGKQRRVRLDSVVRRNILDTVRQVQQEVQNQVGKEFGANGVELSVHQFSAPDHEPIQGHQFTMEEFDKLQSGKSFTDVKGNRFSPIERPIGMWNCRHFAWNIIIGHATPNYTDKQLEDMKQRNAKGITLNNKDSKIQKSMYWCTQQQRRLETQLRKTDELRNAYELAGNTEQQQRIDSLYHKRLQHYLNFSKKCGLTPKLGKVHTII